MSEVQTVAAVFKFLYNEDPVRIFELVYEKTRSEDSHYSAEKVEAMRRDPIRWWGTLDSDHQQRLVDLAIQRSR